MIMSHFNVDNNKTISTSLPEKASSTEQQQNRQDSIDCDEDNIILLRQSIKYTTELKPVPCDVDAVPISPTIKIRALFRMVKAPFL